ncbi:pilus assembly FimT family protein [Ferribacterium limneticum]|uniref:pilus assembly FimT family protein n=1 Tax=Ferribacterium limneticum TaxID=76259 RepID=UPI001CFBB86B|nr:GspH/FimT family pseudopilin [Ferribacterium limneticum]UCV19881.1 prepilin-type N-terminal cleavage/methylation domain-containing protein [Ferribacterium limneticum]
MRVPDRRPGALTGPSVFVASRKWSQTGFTLVELIVVIILLGIMAAVFVPRWRGGSGFEDRGLRDQIAAGLRYAQKSAIAARRTVCVHFSSGPDSVAFTISGAYGAADCTGGNALAGPDGGSLNVVATGNTGFSSSQTSLVFDAAGRPSAATSINISGLPAALVITVEAETGYVH